MPTRSRFAGLKLEEGDRARLKQMETGGARMSVRTWRRVRTLLERVRRMKDIQAPALALIAARDDVVLRPRSEALVAAIPAPLRHVKIFQYATHNDINLQPV